MSGIDLFEKNYQYYDTWFEEHETIYDCEIEAIKRILPPFRKGIEIGVGTGRFAMPLGIKIGVEPSKNMAEIARQRGIEVIDGVAESLPLPDKSFDLILMVTTICFVDDINKTLQECRRVLQDGGYLVIGFVDRNSALGRLYEANKDKSRFYKEATFYGKKEVFALLKRYCFVLERCSEALFGNTLQDLKCKIYDGCKKGGAFLTLVARKRDAANARDE